jgi:hypothetical protein
VQHIFASRLCAKTGKMAREGSLYKLAILFNLQLAKQPFGVFLRLKVWVL